MWYALLMPLVGKILAGLEPHLTARPVLAAVVHVAASVLAGHLAGDLAAPPAETTSPAK